MSDPSSFSDNEAEAIFRRALERQLSDQDGYGREELIAAAREIGLDDEAVDRATKELEVEQFEADIREAVKKRQRERWLRHGIAFITAVGGLLLMQWLALVGTWVFWVALVWTTLMALHTFNVVRGPSEPAVNRERTRRNRKARRKQLAIARAEARRQKKAAQRARAAERARRRSQRSQTEDDFERLIEDGVTLLLGAAAKRMAAAAREIDAPDTEFNRYVKKKRKAGGGAPQTGPARTQVRVEVHDDEIEQAETVDEPARKRARRR